MDFKRVEFEEPISSYGTSSSIRELHERLGIGMGKKFEFTAEGVGSRSYWLSKIRDGGNTANKLKDLARKAWFEAKKALELLEAESLIENVATGVYPQFALTEWGKAEAKRFDDWQGPAPQHSVLPPPRGHSRRRTWHPYFNTGNAPRQAAAAHTGRRRIGGTVCA